MNFCDPIMTVEPENQSRSKSQTWYSVPGTKGFACGPDWQVGGISPYRTGEPRLFPPLTVYAAHIVPLGPRTESSEAGHTLLFQVNVGVVPALT